MAQENGMVYQVSVSVLLFWIFLPNVTSLPANDKLMYTVFVKPVLQFVYLTLKSDLTSLLVLDVVRQRLLDDA